MRHKQYSILATAVGLAVAVMPGTAFGLVSWTFDSANCASTDPTNQCGSSDFSRYRTYEGVGPDAVDVTVSGWANTISSNTQLELGEITHYNGGLGVRNADGPRGQDTGEYTDPEHAIDNDQRFDMVLFDFGNQLVNLSEVSLGYRYQDADITVLAYEGGLDPTDSGSADYIGDRVAWWLSDTDQDEDLTSHGWTLIGNHDVDSGDTTVPYTQIVNADDVESSYWLVSAYNPVFGSDCTPANNYCQSDYKDHFKIQTLVGEVGQPPIPPANLIPEPATALLLAAGAPLVRRRIRARGV